MSSTSPASSPRRPATAYARKATGMVREVGFFELLVFNASAPGALGILLTIGLFYAYGSFPGGNLPLAIIISLLLVPFVLVAFSLMSAAFPRAGGDYIFGSRVLHPIVGLASNFASFASTVLSCGLWALYVTKVGLSPAFAVVGAATGNDWWTHASSTLTDKGWAFGLGLVLILLLMVLSMDRTKLVMRVMSYAWVFGCVGVVVSAVILLFTSRQHFVHVLNHFSEPFTHNKNTYRETIAAGAKNGLRYPDVHGYSFKNTVGMIYVGFTLSIYCWWGTYMSGETKGAGRRRRQLGAMLGAGIGQALVILVIMVIFTSTVGTNFFIAANNGGYPVNVPPFYNFFASIIAGSPVVAVFLAVTYVAFLIPGAYINFAMPQRALFAWAFDGIIPRRAASVNERTHTPILAITLATLGAAAATAYAVFGSNFLQFITTTALFTALPMFVTGLCAVVLPLRLPQIYKDSPANWRIRGVPVAPIAGVGCMIVSAFFAGLICYFHKTLGENSAWVWPATIPASFIVAAVWYVVARRLQRARGVELDYVFKTIPPE